ncbi:hypothetical protein JG687_00007836 [Phytophthora cactorum]|uniref:Uncharacterized protein n=1 Tax=Phytophthora cactorum TaxID=29920 RepID=A0A8T1UGD8_9STRA|nr:hypothetical protein JG687_00007836 [Phytophthora cactorum]
MVSVVSSTMAFVPFLLSMISRYVEAHTWLDCIDTDRSKIYDQSASYIFGGAGGNGFCEGYGAGYPGRGDIDIGTGYTYKMLKNEVEAGTPVCQNVGANTYTDWRKRISVAPGQTAYFAYLPNGHIVKDKKGVGTQHGVYWTGQVGTSLTSTLDMKPENLLGGHTMNYDDGNCGETVDYNGAPSGRAGDGTPCVGSFVVPAGTAPGVYNMVWYWTFWLDDQAAYIDQTQAKGYFGTVAPEPADGSGDDGLPPAKYVATVHPPIDSSASANSTSASGSDAGEVGQVGQEEPSAPSMVVTAPASQSGSESKSMSGASATTMESAADSVKTIERVTFTASKSLVTTTFTVSSW